MSRAKVDHGQGADFLASKHGSLCTLTPLSSAANDWCAENLEGATLYAGSVVIEPRFIGQILEGIVNDGLTWERS